MLLGWLHDRQMSPLRSICAIATDQHKSSSFKMLNVIIFPFLFSFGSTFLPQVGTLQNVKGYPFVVIQK